MIKLYEIFQEQRMKEAADHLLTKNNSHGPDGMPLHEVWEYWQMNKDAIVEMAEHNSLPLVTVRETEIIQGNGKRRRIVQMNALDRLIMRSLSRLLQERWEPLLSHRSYAFRKDKGLTEALKEMVRFAEQGFEWVAELDIHNCFDNIPQDRLLGCLRERIDDEGVIELVRHYLQVKVLREEGSEIKCQGILQGSPVSPVLSNIYLDGLDKALEVQGANFVRYCDNIYLFTKGPEEAQNRLNYTRKQLEKTYALPVHPGKTGVFSVFEHVLLGHKLIRDKASGRILAEKNKKGLFEIYRQWQPSAIRKIDRNYHLVNDGILTKKDFTILFENEEGKRYIPVETTDSLNVYAGVILSGDFLRYLGEKKLQLNVFDKYGNLAGRFLGGGVQSHVKTLMEQVLLYNDESKRLAIAKSIIMAAAHNMRANVRYYKKQKNEEHLPQIEQEMNVLIRQMNEAKTVPLLLLTEARFRQYYYEAFSVFLTGSGFVFRQRTKRPPRDAVNAMLSFGNTMLYNRLATEIIKSGLEIRVAYLHSTNNRRQSLNLDLAEIFKPVIVDRVIFTLVNKRMLDAEKDFERTEEGGIYLSKDGKRTFIAEFERKLYQKIEIDGTRISYDTLMRREVKSFKKAVDSGTPYKAYKYY